MVVLANRVRVATATTGTGTITLGAAVAGYQTLASGGVSDGDVVRYVIEDGTAWEIGTGTYTASGQTLTRTVSESSNSGSAINLSGGAEVFVTAVAEDIVTPDGTQTLSNKTLTSPVVNLGADGTGDLYYRTAGGAFARLPIGAANEVLTVSSGLPAWAAASGGTVSVVSSGTISSAATLELTLDETLYDRFELCLYNVKPSTSSDLLMRVSEDGGTTFLSGSVDYTTSVHQLADTTAISSLNVSSSIELSSITYDISSSYYGLTAVYDIFNPHGGGAFTMSGLVTVSKDTSSKIVAGRVLGLTRVARNVDAIQIYFSTGNIASGAYVLYGYAKGA